MQNAFPPEQLQALLDQAAEAGARRALDRIGLHDEDAPHDLRELRGLLEAWRDAKRTATQMIVRSVVVALLGLMAAGVAWKSWRE
jgi:hypothetical protein